MKRTVWTFGLIAGGILSAMMLLAIPFQDAIGFDRGEVIGYTTMVLAFLLVYFGVRSYRDNVAGGRITFGRALGVGSLIVLVASVCYVATWEAIFFGIAPEYGARLVQYSVDRAKASGESPEVIQKKVVEAEKFARLYRNPAVNAAFTFVEPLPVGLLFVLLSAGILSRKRRNPESGLAATVG